jgi:hypothetical protein
MLIPLSRIITPKKMEIITVVPVPKRPRLPVIAPLTRRKSRTRAEPSRMMPIPIMLQAAIGISGTISIMSRPARRDANPRMDRRRL